MKTMISLIVTMLILMVHPALANTRYGESLCNEVDYFCIKIKAGETWEKLFPSDEERDIVRRLNRMNVRLRSGMVIAVPKNIDRLSVYDVSPFPRYIKSDGEKTIFISQQKLAWGAYDEDGELLWWGPISTGVDQCNARGGCSTPTGEFRVIRKQDIECISTVFPRRSNGENGGALMPYCMHFFRGFALHGSYEVPGYPASHGCVRMFIEDARWLNEEFIDVPGDGLRGTRVVIDSITDRHEQ